MVPSRAACKICSGELYGLLSGYFAHLLLKRVIAESKGTFLAAKVRKVSVMANRGCVVLLGDFSNERLDLASVGRDFSWSVAQASDLSALREICRSRTVLAVLIEAGAVSVPWPNAIRAIRGIAPRARIIGCHKVGQSHSRTEMVKSGAFGVLLLPLARSEVRQTLGFVWASKITPPSHVPCANARVVAA